MQQPSPWPPIVIDALFVISITLLLALKVVPTEIGFPLLSMFAGARGAMHLASKGGGGPGASGGAASSGTPSAPSPSTTLQRVMSGSAVAVLGIALLGYLRRHVPGVAVVALALFVAGCSPSLRNGVVASVNAESDLGTGAEHVLASLDRTEQRACVRENEAPATRRECALAVRARFHVAWDIYREYEAAWAASAAGVHSYDASAAAVRAPDPSSLLKAATSLADATEKLRAAFEGLKALVAPPGSVNAAKLGGMS